MVRTKKVDPVELTHNAESCVCSDCKTRKLELEVIDLKARYADERAHYDARLKEVKDSLVNAMTRMEARLSINDDTLRKRFDREAGIATPSRESLSRRIGRLEERITDLEKARTSKVVEDIGVESKIIQRLRVLESGRPVDIRDRDLTAITRELTKARASLENISSRLNPPF
jgi:hypothetical protein